MQKLVRRWGVLSANRECEEPEKRILRETSFIYGGEFVSKLIKTVAKSVVGWCGNSQQTCGTNAGKSLRALNASIEEDGNSRKRAKGNGKRGEAGDGSSTD